MRSILLSWVVFTNIVFEDLKKSIIRIECRNHYCRVVFWLHFYNYLLSSSFLYFFLSMLYSSCWPFCLSFLPLSFSTFLSNTLSLYPLSLSLFFFFFLFHIFPSLFLPVIRLNNTAGQFKCDSKLEISLLNYFKSFKKIYMVDTANTGMSIVPGGMYVMN